MNKYMNYIILGANAVVSISVAIVLGVFLNGFKYMGENPASTVFDSLKWTVCIPIIGLIAGSCLIGLYVYLLKKFMKENTTPINPKLLEGFKWATIASMINFIAPLALSITAIYIYDEFAAKTMLWVGFGISAAVSLAIIGFTTYLNVGINFAMLSREELMKRAEEENAAFEKSKHASDKPTKESNTSKKDKSDHKPKEEASAGGF